MIFYRIVCWVWIMNGIVLRNPTKMTQNLISSSQRAADKVFSYRIRFFYRVRFFLPMRLVVTTSLSELVRDRLPIPRNLLPVFHEVISWLPAESKGKLSELWSK